MIASPGNTPSHHAWLTKPRPSAKISRKRHARTTRDHRAPAATAGRPMRIPLRAFGGARDADICQLGKGPRIASRRGGAQMASRACPRAAGGRSTRAGLSRAVGDLPELDPSAMETVSPASVAQPMPCTSGCTASPHQTPMAKSFTSRSDALIAGLTCFHSRYRQKTNGVEGVNRPRTAQGAEALSQHRRARLRDHDLTAATPSTLH